MRLRTWCIALIAAPAALALACGEDCAEVVCAQGVPAAAVVTVTSAAGQPLEGVRASVDGGPSSACERAGDGLTWTCFAGFGPGSYPVRIEAAGHQPADVVVAVPATRRFGCCALGYEPASAAVALQPL